MSRISTVNNSSVNDLLMKMKGQFARAFPISVSADRFVRLALTEIKDNPKLGECDVTSFLGCLMMCAQLGLEPGKTLGHAYIIPYGQKATFVLGYRGMIELMMRSGKVSSIVARDVYEKDDFSYEYGLEEKLHHIPASGDRGKLIYAYVVVRMKEGGHVFTVMSRDDIEKVRKSSKTGNAGPWCTHYEQMALKSVIRRIYKYCPMALSLDMTAQQAFMADEAGDRGEQQDYLPNEFDIDIDSGETATSKSVTEQLTEIL